MGLGVGCLGHLRAGKQLNDAKISILPTRMRELVLGSDASLTAVALTTILTVPSGLTDASLTLAFILEANNYKIEQ